jgi:hypothetical protein
MTLCLEAELAVWELIFMPPQSSNKRNGIGTPADNEALPLIYKVLLACVVNLKIML